MMMMIIDQSLKISPYVASILSRTLFFSSPPYVCVYNSHPSLIN